VRVEPRLLAVIDDLPVITTRREVFVLRVERLAAQPERVDVTRRVRELFEDLAEDDDRARVVLRPIEELSVREPLLDGVTLRLRALDRGLHLRALTVDARDLLLRTCGVAVGVGGARSRRGERRGEH